MDVYSIVAKGKTEFYYCCSLVSFIELISIDF